MPEIDDDRASSRSSPASPPPEAGYTAGISKHMEGARHEGKPALARRDDRLVEIEFLDSGLEAFAFTFG